MLSSHSLAAFALAFLQTTQAMNTALQREFALMADMGLNPDGTPSHPSSLTTRALFPNNTEIITPEYVELPLNHFSHGSYGSDDGTFFNRFWVSERAYRPGGPVFVYDVGEADAESNALFRLQNETSFFKQIVEQFGGVGIVWEHRFCEYSYSCFERVAKLHETLWTFRSFF